MLGLHTRQALSEHEIHDVLRNERRTRALRYLKRKRRTVTLRELAEALASAETGESPPPRNVRESVYNSLHQTHLPKLDRLGIVEYESDRKLIHLCEAAKQVELYMEVIPEHGVTWATYYRALGVLSLVVLLLAGFGVPAFGALPAVAWAGSFLVLFVLSALFQSHDRQGFVLGRLRR
jgi:hypothetical protein